MKAILRSINNFSCKLKQSNNLKYNISPKIRSNKFKSISGNGNVTIEDAIKKDLKDYRVYGNTYQNSTSGKNICLQANIIDTNTIRFDINSNEINRTFTLSLIPPLSVNSMSIVAFADGVNLRSVGTINLISGERSTTTITLTESIYNTIQNASEVHFNLYKSGAGISTTSIIEESQIENNSSFTSYEPYTGGQPSPSPEFNQKIISCGDKTKNMFDINSEDVGYVYDISGNYNASALWNTSDWINVKENTKYIRSNKTTNTTNAFISEFDGNKNFIQRTTASSFTTTNNTKYIKLSYKNDLGMYDIQLEENSIATSYEPYGYKIPVNVRSENLFDIDTISNIGGGTNNNGIITSTTRSTSGTINLNFKFSDILVKAGETLYFSADIKLNNDSIGTFSTINDNVHAGATKIIYPTLNNKYQRYQTSYTYSNDETVKSMLIQIGNLLGSFEVSNIMISKDDSIIYKPYYNETTNIYLDEPLRKSDDGTYVDHIDFENKKVYRQIKEITLNGTEAWSRVSAKNNHYRFRVTYSDLAVGADRVLYCTHFKNNGDAYSFEGISGSTSNVLYIRWDELFETVDDLKTWLSSNTPIVDYVLKTPTEDDIELPNINLIEGKNIITIGAEVQGVFEAEYYSKEIIDISNYKYNLRKVED